MNSIERAKLLVKRHKELHSIVEVLEAEKAPEKIIKIKKIEKLKLKDEIERLQKQ
jgi:hypothetical protein